MAEKVLWYELRDRRLGGYKFRRQFSIGPFIADFYCHECKLIVEVDGPIHYQQIEYDRNRDHWFRIHGYITKRFTNDQVLFRREYMLQDILDLCKELKRRKY